MRKEILFKEPGGDPAASPANPALLTHPHIPKPLHGVAPRTVLGEVWWEKEKARARHAARSRCQACGEFSGNLEAHETYGTDYKTGVAKYLKTVMLCHSCHNFIHSGRLEMIAGKEKTIEEVKAILAHGFRILAAANRTEGRKLKAFPATCELADALQVKRHGVRASKLPDSTVPWEAWRLEINNKRFAPVFPTYGAWENHFAPKPRSEG